MSTMISALSGLLGVIITIATLIVTEYRRAKTTSVRTAVLEEAVAVLGYEKLRLDILKLIGGRLPQAETERAIERLNASDRAVEVSALSSQVPWKRMRRRIAVAPVTYSVLLIAVN